MGFRKSVKRLGQKHLKYINPQTTIKGATNAVQKTFGRGEFKIDDNDASGDARSQAATKVMKDQQKQAGGGQVKFTAEEYE